MAKLRMVLMGTERPRDTSLSERWEGTRIRIVSCTHHDGTHGHVRRSLQSMLICRVLHAQACIRWTDVHAHILAITLCQAPGMIAAQML